MASGLGGGSAGMSAASAALPQANAARPSTRSSERQQDSFGSVLAGTGATTDSAPQVAAANSTKTAASDIPPEEGTNDDTVPDQILNLIDLGTWPTLAPPPAGRSPGDPLSADTLASPFPSTVGAQAIAITDAASGTSTIEPGSAGGAPMPSVSRTGMAVPLARPAVANGDGGSGEIVLTVGAATGSDTTNLAAASDAERGDPIEFILPGQQSLASSTARASAPALVGAAVTMPVDPDAGFDDSFGARIGWMAEQRIGHAQIRVSPDHVGPIDVRLQLEGNRVNVEFVSANADVRQTLESSVGRLRELLDQQGLQLAHTNVGNGQSDSSRERAPADAAGESGSDEIRAEAGGAPESIVMRRGLLDEYA